ncbi:hypothetical protein R3W88_008378 [Solanum pinnatisectum]|uniref:Uncharacterized protein n=1 Tax=Solanum pinnatisectum TaxID=50273 RepID=A0AAV9M9R3_9SOLN|nr:hypothetical protein R3W88_008378 [Solanum pinnatisectum]
MAEMAMLVAEEYERRVNNSRKYCGIAAGEEEEIEMFSYFSTLVKNIYESPSFSSSRITMRLSKIKINEKMIHTTVFQPQSDVSLAASNGVFSA